LNPDAKDAVKVQALKTIGTITEVAAFTEQKVVRTISSSEDARARVMQELRGLLTSGASDATIIDADSLLAELDGSDKFNGSPAVETTEAPSETPPHPDPPDAAGGVPRP
jgi:hypothetical protein